MVLEDDATLDSAKATLLESLASKPILSAPNIDTEVHFEHDLHDDEGDANSTERLSTSVAQVSHQMKKRDPDEEQAKFKVDEHISKARELMKVKITVIKR